MYSQHANKLTYCVLPFHLRFEAALDVEGEVSVIGVCNSDVVHASAQHYSAGSFNINSDKEFGLGLLPLDDVEGY